MLDITPDLQLRRTATAGHSLLGELVQETNHRSRSGDAKPGDENLSWSPSFPPPSKQHTRKAKPSAGNKGNSRPGRTRSRSLDPPQLPGHHHSRRSSADSSMREPRRGCCDAVVIPPNAMGRSSRWDSAPALPKTTKNFASSSRSCSAAAGVSNPTLRRRSGLLAETPRHDANGPSLSIAGDVQSPAAMDSSLYIPSALPRIRGGDGEKHQEAQRLNSMRRKFLKLVKKGDTAKQPPRRHLSKKDEPELLDDLLVLLNSLATTCGEDDDNHVFYRRSGSNKSLLGRSLSRSSTDSDASDTISMALRELRNKTQQRRMADKESVVVPITNLYNLLDELSISEESCHIFLSARNMLTDDDCTI